MKQYIYTCSNKHEYTEPYKVSTRSIDICCPVCRPPKPFEGIPHVSVKDDFWYDKVKKQMIKGGAFEQIKERQYNEQKADRDALNFLKKSREKLIKTGDPRDG